MRTRQLFPCKNDFAKVCTDLEADGKVVECQQDRFRYVCFEVKQIKFFYHLNVDVLKSGHVMATWGLIRA